MREKRQGAGSTRTEVSCLAVFVRKLKMAKRENWRGGYWECQKLKMKILRYLCFYVFEKQPKNWRDFFLGLFLWIATARRLSYVDGTALQRVVTFRNEVPSCESPLPQTCTLPLTYLWTNRSSQVIGTVCFSTVCGSLCLFSSLLPAFHGLPGCYFPPSAWPEP